MASTSVLSPPVSTPVSARFYRPELDSLRFFAFFAVFFYHRFDFSMERMARQGVFSGLAELVHPFVRAGSYGVNLFFVLSAYLITELLFREKEERGQLDVSAFYVRRILRIWPLYFAFLALVAIIPGLHPQNDFGWQYLGAFFLLVGNWSIVLLGWPHTVANQLWSVSIEEQFYLLWPPLVKRSSRKMIAILAILMILVANISRLFSVLHHQLYRQIWCSTFAELDSIAVGILAAAILKGAVPNIKSGFRIMFASLGVIVIILTAFYLTVASGEMPSSWRTLLEFPLVAGGCLLILLATVGTQSRLMQSETLRYLGKISYGLYVYHELGIQIADWGLRSRVTGAVGVGIRACVAMIITIAFAAGSYAWFEKYFLKLKQGFTYVQSRPV